MSCFASTGGVESTKMESVRGIFLLGVIELPKIYYFFIWSQEAQRKVGQIQSTQNRKSTWIINIDHQFNGGGRVWGFSGAIHHVTKTRRYFFKASISKCFSQLYAKDNLRIKCPWKFIYIYWNLVLTLTRYMEIFKFMLALISSKYKESIWHLPAVFSMP